MSESDIAALCRRIYQKHQRALDLIYEHRPDRQTTVQMILEKLIQETPGMVLDAYLKGNIRFVVQEWDVSILLEGKDWTASHRILLFEFRNEVDALKLSLYIGPGPQETRQKLFDMATQKMLPFKPASKTLRNKWNVIYQRPFLTAKSYEDTSDDEIEAEIRKHWAAFFENDLPKIKAVLKAEDWIWQSAKTTFPMQGG